MAVLETMVEAEQRNEVVGLVFFIWVKDDIVALRFVVALLVSVMHIGFGRHSWSSMALEWREGAYTCWLCVYSYRYILCFALMDFVVVIHIGPRSLSLCPFMPRRPAATSVFVQYCPCLHCLLKLSPYVCLLLERHTNEGNLL